MKPKKRKTPMLKLRKFSPAEIHALDACVENKKMLEEFLLGANDSNSNSFSNPNSITLKEECPERCANTAGEHLCAECPQFRSFK